MQATCPKNPKNHRTFITTAHVMQEWKVDENGNFLKVTCESLEVTSRPDIENLWHCATCGAEAKVRLT